ncbi:ciliary BBSome complex subunit 2 [Polychytrium aggregatum]|uniref:ciliary BBSome complex subunit 2 n=1 Tax=Polychytrium aggregatum TaxID=110093 RepID=UPI0022FEC518|nr:ciliary BBSome complex subunit 2 [Polychytrium aggregatum]KAI9190577.1 ciliary BBSome complex subunit 2 [Polychytrium aggregatum]
MNHTRDSKSIEFKAIDIRNNRPICIEYVNERLSIRSDDINIVGALIQNLVSFTGLREGRSTVTFPSDIEELKQIIEAIESMDESKIRGFTEVADLADQAKQLLLRAEDQRQLRFWDSSRGLHAEAYGLSQDLLREYKKRAEVSKARALLSKRLHAAIERFSNLRVGLVRSKWTQAAEEHLRLRELSHIARICAFGISE